VSRSKPNQIFTILNSALAKLDHHLFLTCSLVPPNQMPLACTPSNGQTWQCHCHAGHVTMSLAPSLFSPLQHVPLIPLDPLSMLVSAVGRGEDDKHQTRARPRRPGPCRRWHGRAHGHAQCTRRPSRSQHPRTPSLAQHLATAPRTRQTLPCPRPAPAVAGDDDQTPPRTLSTSRPPDQVWHRLASP
jgi:hypothetical protein